MAHCAGDSTGPNTATGSAPILASTSTYTGAHAGASALYILHGATAPSIKDMGPGISPGPAVHKGDEDKRRTCGAAREEEMGGKARGDGQDSGSLLDCSC